MDDGIPLRYAALLLLLLLGSAYFAGTEIAFASVNRVRLQTNAEKGDAKSRRALYVLNHFDLALSTLLIGNNVMHIAIATIATLMTTRIWGVGAVGYGTLVTTFAVFYAAEMLPKCVARACSESFALYAAAPLIALMYALYPVSSALSAVGRFASRLFSRPGARQPTVTESELTGLIDTSADDGQIAPETGELVKSALGLARTCARDVMTPWQDVARISRRLDAQNVRRVMRECGYSRLVVVGSRDEPVGTLLMRKFLKACVDARASVTPESEMDAPFFVSADAPVDSLLRYMSVSRAHLAIVRERDRRVVGILTVEDILEELVGEIYDESDEEAPGEHA